jgi:hypothetical protein
MKSSRLQLFLLLMLLGSASARAETVSNAAASAMPGDPPSGLETEGVLQPPRQVTLRFTFDPKRKWPANEPMTIAIPVMNSPFQSGNYRLTNVRGYREVNIGGNIAVEISPQQDQPFYLEMNLSIRKANLNPFLKRPDTNAPPLPDEARAYLLSSSWINLNTPLLR